MPREPKGALEALKAFGKVRSPKRKDRIGHMQVGRLTVSTVYVHDLECYETALVVDGMNAHPVERYDERIEAEEGHAQWIRKAPHLTEFTKLGYGDVVPPTTIRL